MQTQMDPTATPVTDRKYQEKLAALVQAGTTALREGSLESALDSFEAVIRCFPDSPEGYNNLGALYASLGRTAEAEECFGRVLEILPGNPNIHYNRGLMRARQENFAAATLDFEAVLHHDPGDPDAHNNLGVAAYVEGNALCARAHFQAALQTKPDHLGALINLCDLDEATGKTEEALALCREHLAHQNDYTVRRRMLGLLMNRAIGDLAASAEEARALVTLNPEDADALAELGRLEKALPILQAT